MSVVMCKLKKTKVANSDANFDYRAAFELRIVSGADNVT